MLAQISCFALAGKPLADAAQVVSTTGVHEIPFDRLALTFLPVAVVIGVLFRWSLGTGTALYAMGRMLLQLLLIGYVLTTIFQTDAPGLVGAVLATMLIIASWISLRPLQKRDGGHYLRALASISVGGVLTLLLVTQGVLKAQPWFEPRLVIPLAGMIFANSMNAVSLAAERYFAELENLVDPSLARGKAMGAALIPMTNSLLAVGLVSLPGMMTGQILSGVDPLIAARYQIMVMAMLYGSAGISAACYLTWVQPLSGRPV